jgi:hypothetical protein
MPDDPDASPLLDAAEIAVIAVIAQLGSRRRVGAGKYLYPEGDVSHDFYVVVSGDVEIVVGAGAEPTSGWLSGCAALPFETSHPAVGEGSAAVRSVHEYLAFAR